MAAGPSDADGLIERFKAGDEGAFDELVLLFQTRIFNLALRMLNSYDDAAEVTQEIFVRVYRSIGKFRGQSSFLTWLYTVARNMCCNRLRQTRRLSRYEVQPFESESEDGTHGAPEMADPERNPAQRAEGQEIRALVEQGIAALPPDFGTVMIMRDIQGMEYSEIAEALDCSLGTVKSRLSRARLMVREKLSGVL